VTRLARAGVLAIVGGWAAIVAVASPAGAQEEPIGNVVISFDVGEFDPVEDDWSVDVVEVSGDLQDGVDFTVELTGEDGEVVWSATESFTAPVTRIEVTTPLMVGEVAEAGVSQGITEVAGVQIEPPVLEWKGGGGGGGGQLALSMVLAVLLVAIIFRTPLPSATTQRWTK
jgi:hypothetical protein